MTMRVDDQDFRNMESEKARIADLMAILPDGLDTVLDIGARDGFISKLLASRCSSVTALDLERPAIEHERIQCVKGDSTALEYADECFDLVFCAEVLEHIPSNQLAQACRELSRVSRRYIVVGVPFKQDIRVGRTTCSACGGKNPPWGHVNAFDETRIEQLFPAHAVIKRSYVGVAEPGTNFMATWLMDLAGNPYGTYVQDEPCIHCGAAIMKPPARSWAERFFTRASMYARSAGAPFDKPHANWIHVLMAKNPA